MVSVTERMDEAGLIIKSLAYLNAESTATHPDDIWALKWTSGNHLLSGAADGHLRIFDAAEPAVAVYDLPAHPLAVTSLSVTRDGRYALSASLDGNVVLSDVREGRIRGRVESGREKVGGAPEIPAYACSIHPQTSAYAWSGRSSKVVLRSISADSLDVNGGDADGRTGGPANGNGNSHSEESVGKGPLGGEGTVIDTGKGKFAMDVNFSPDGRQLAISTDNGHISIIDTESQAVTASYQSHAMAVRTISWSHDSQWLYSGSDDHRIVLHDIRAGSKSGSGGKGEGAVAIMQGHQSWVLSVAAGPDGRLLGSAGADKQIRLWDIGQRTSVFTSTAAAPVWAFDWQPADVTVGSLGVGKQFVVGGDEKKVMIYRAAGSV